MYRIFRDGKLIQEEGDIRGYWREDLVTFLIGCSYTFEEALVRGGVPIRNYLKQKDPGIYVVIYPVVQLEFFPGLWW